MNNFKAQTFETQLSTGRKVSFRELSGLEQISADACAPEGAPMSAVYFRAAMAITAIDGEELAPATGKTELMIRLQSLSGRELDECLRAYYDNVNRNLEADLPKESAPVV